MHSRLLIWASILLAACVYGQQSKPYLTGTLIELDSMQCGANNKDVQHNSVETPNAVNPEIQTLCPEYMLEADQATYQIVSSNTDHPAPLPIGESVLFRLRNGKMLVRVPAFDNKEREYIVVSMRPHASSTAAAGPIRLNHLQ